MWTINQKCVFGLVVGCFALPFCNSVLIGKHIWSLVFLIQVKTGAISKYRTYQVKLPPPVIKSDYESFLIYRVKLPPPLNKRRRRKKITKKSDLKDFQRIFGISENRYEKVRKKYGKCTGTGTGTGCVMKTQFQVRVRVRVRVLSETGYGMRYGVRVVLSWEVRRRVRVKNELNFRYGYGYGYGWILKMRVRVRIRTRLRTPDPGQLGI